MGTTANDIVKSAAGVEFGLKWGIGRVESVTTPKGKVNGRVQFRQDGFRHPSAGSVEIRRQAALIEMLREAEGSEDVYFAFRLESHRDDKVDKDTPFADIVQEGKVNDNTAELIHSRLIAAFPDGTPEAKALIDLCELEAVGVVAQATRSVENEPSDKQLPGESWEFAAKMGCVDLAFETFIKQDRKITQADLEELAGQFLRIADTAQTALSGRLVRGGRAHTRARGAMRTALERYPVPVHVPFAEQMILKEYAAARQKMISDWEEQLTKVTISLLKAGEAI